MAAPGGKTGTVFFLIAQSISPGAKELLRNERVGYYDSGGSLFLPTSNIYVLWTAAPEKPVAVIFVNFPPLFTAVEQCCTRSVLATSANGWAVRHRNSPGIARDRLAGFLMENGEKFRVARVRQGSRKGAL